MDVIHRMSGKIHLELPRLSKVVTLETEEIKQGRMGGGSDSLKFGSEDHLQRKFLRDAALNYDRDQLELGASAVNVLHNLITGIDVDNLNEQGDFNEECRSTPEELNVFLGISCPIAAADLEYTKNAAEASICEKAEESSIFHHLTCSMEGSSYSFRKYDSEDTGLPLGVAK